MVFHGRGFYFCCSVWVGLMIVRRGRAWFLCCVRAPLRGSLIVCSRLFPIVSRRALMCLGLDTRASLRAAESLAPRREKKK